MRTSCGSPVTHTREMFAQRLSHRDFPDVPIGSHRPDRYAPLQRTALLIRPTAIQRELGCLARYTEVVIEPIEYPFPHILNVGR